MDKILIKKFNELKIILDRFMEDATILSNADTNNIINNLLNSKLDEFKKWVDNRKIVNHKIVKKNKKYIPSIFAKINKPPSYMLPTISSLSSANNTPRSCSINNEFSRTIRDRTIYNRNYHDSYIIYDNYIFIKIKK